MCMAVHMFSLLGPCLGPLATLWKGPSYKAHGQTNKFMLQIASNNMFAQKRSTWPEAR